MILMKNMLFAVLITAVIIGVGSFFGGMQYGKSQTGSLSGIPSDFGNFDPSQLGNFAGGPGAGGGFARAGAGGNGFASGEILSIDEDSITISLPDGGSRLVFFSDTSKVTMSEEGAVEDLVSGISVMVTGESNDDGSVTAATIQILPEDVTIVESNELDVTE
jgi:hypothetical protein